MTDIIGKIRNFQTPYIFPKGWAILILSVLAIGWLIGVGVHIYCMVTLGFM